MSSQFGPPQHVITAGNQISDQAMEEIAQRIEQRGIRIPISQVTGYQKERLVVRVENAAQSIPDSVETVLTFSVVKRDAQQVFNGTDTFTLPFNGTYLATGYTVWGSNTTGARFTSIGQNGVARARDWRAATATAANGSDSTLSCIIVGLKGDLVKRTVEQDSGGPLSTQAATFELALLSAY